MQIQTRLLERASQMSLKNDFEFYLGLVFSRGCFGAPAILSRGAEPKRPRVKTVQFYYVFQDEIATKILFRKLQDKDCYVTNLFHKFS